ncbi:MAG: hypothetical protein IPK80_15855 [Nannocystis sp.]|nr:hypothetical protein [Nannocystis sp.]
MEHGDRSICDYGCGLSRTLKALAISLAEERPLPFYPAFRAAGGGHRPPPAPQSACAWATADHLARDRRATPQICVAAVGDGEFRLVQTEGGSFTLAFARKGDTDFDRLGCGATGSPRVRALDLLGPAQRLRRRRRRYPAPEKKRRKSHHAPAGTSKAMPTAPKTPKKNQPRPICPPSIDYASTDKELMDSLAGAVRRAMRGADPTRTSDVT